MAKNPTGTTPSQAASPDNSGKVQVRITDQAGGKNVNARLPVDVSVAQLLQALIVKLQMPPTTPYYMVHKESGKRLADNDTLHSAGINHGDTIRLVPDVTAGGMTIRDYRDLQIIDMYLNRKQLASGNTYNLYAIFLYTAADSNISQFVRKHFTELHSMSRARFQFYIVEQPDNKWLPFMREELAEKLGPHFKRVWKMLEESEFHPIDSTSVFDIATHFGVTLQQLPCAVFFTGLNSRRVLIVPFRSLLGYQVAKADEDALLFMFRQLFDEIFTVMYMPRSERLPLLKKELNRSAKTKNSHGKTLTKIVLATLAETIQAVVSGAISALLK